MERLENKENFEETKKGIAEASKNLIDLADDDLTGDEAKDILGFGEVTNYDSLRDNLDLLNDYNKNRAHENYDFMVRKGHAHLAKVYQDIVTDKEFYTAGLQSVKIGQMTDDERKKHGEANAFFSNIRNEDGAGKGGARAYVPIMHYNFDNASAYTEQHTDFKGHLEGLDMLMASMALKVGAKPSDVVNNPKFVQAFIFCHEFGHAQDFMGRLGEERKKYDKNQRRAVPDICEKWAKEQKREKMGSPDTVGGRSVLMELFYGRFAEKDTRSWEEAKALSSRAYRRKGKEKYADDYATRYILKHYDEYFCDSDDTKGISEGKIPTRVGNYMKVGENMVPMLDFTASSSVYMQQVGDDYKPIAQAGGGFLKSSLRRGQEITLSMNGDPYSKRQGWSIGSKVQEVGIIPSKKKNGLIEPVTIITFENGLKFRMMRAEIEMPEVDEDAKKMVERLGLREGDLFRMMKRELTGRSVLSEGAIMSGELKRPDGVRPEDGPIVMDRGIHVESVRDGLRGGNTSAVTRIYRKWKTYYVETSGGPKNGGSVYEVLRSQEDIRRAKKEGRY